MSGTVPQNPYTIGRNVQVIFLWNGTRYDLATVTGFTSKQMVKKQRVEPLNSKPVIFNTPTGWTGTITTDRGSGDLDKLINAIEAAYWAALTVGSGTLYTYITERDRSVSRFQYTGVAIEVSQAGNYVAEGVVKQTIEFDASDRITI